jgi:hypothetical protein
MENTKAKKTVINIKTPLEKTKAKITKCNQSQNSYIECRDEGNK